MQKIFFKTLKYEMVSFLLQLLVTFVSTERKLFCQFDSICILCLE